MPAPITYLGYITSHNFSPSMLKSTLHRLAAPLSRSISSYQYLKVETPSPKVYHVQLNRPDKRNALNMEMWAELGNCFDELSVTPDCRAVVLSGNGKMFCAGIDLSAFLSVVPKQEDIAHRSLELINTIKRLQDSFTSVEKCRKPVIAAIHGACIGGGVDIICATDIRLISADAYFQVKEVDIGIAADVGTIQRLPKIVGNQSLVNEYCLTARKFYADEASRVGIVSAVYPDRAALLENAVALAARIASKSPVAVQGTKSNLVFSRDHTVQQGLDRIGLWNAAMLLGADPINAMTGADGFGDP